MVGASICFDVVDLVSLLYLLHGTCKATKHKPAARFTLYIPVGPNTAIAE